MKKLAKYLLLLALSPAFGDTYNIYPPQQQTVVQQPCVQYPLANYRPEYRQVLYIGESGNTIKLDDESCWTIETSTFSFRSTPKEELINNLVKLMPANHSKPGNYYLQWAEKDITLRIQEDSPANKLNPGNYNFSHLQGKQVILTNTIGRQFTFHCAHAPTSWQLNDTIVVAREKDSCCGSYWKYYIYSFEASEGVKANREN